VTAVAPTSPSGAPSDDNLNGSNLRITTDSANATIVGYATTSDSNTVTVKTSTANSLTKVVFTYTVRKMTTAGSFGYTLQMLQGSTRAVLASQLYTVTVAASDSSASAATSLLYFNQAQIAAGATGSILPARPYIWADSTTPISAGQNADLTLMTPTQVGYIMANFKNAAGDSVVSTNSGINVNGTITLKITSGPGFFGRGGDTAGALVRQINLTRGDSAVVYNDGSSGVSTITGYIGGVPLTQAAKTITFYGKATSLVATANAVTSNGWNLSYQGTDTTTSGVGIVTFLAKDAAGIAVPSASQNTKSALYLISSDTKVVRGIGTLNAYSACTAPSSATDVAAGKWSCDVNVIDSGTVTLTVADSWTVASSPASSNAVSVTVAGAPYTGDFSFSAIGSSTAKTSFNTGDNALVTITCKDRAGRTCGQSSASGAAITSMFTWPTLDQTKQFWMGATISTTGGVSTGTTTLTTLKSFLTANAAFFGGTETAVVTMPLTAGDLTINAYTNYDSSTQFVNVTKTLTINDAAADAAGAKATNAQAAADAATDAALQAIDAANAATDAANLAAEAADAATVAAQEAKDAADAATAAVESLATQVATLMAALQAQITSLANVVAKIAKKVKA